MNCRSSLVQVKFGYLTHTLIGSSNAKYANQCIFERLNSQTCTDKEGLFKSHTQTILKKFLMSFPRHLVNIRAVKLSYYLNSKTARKNKLLHSYHKNDLLTIKIGLLKIDTCSSICRVGSKWNIN